MKNNIKLTLHATPQTKKRISLFKKYANEPILLEDFLYVLDGSNIKCKCGGFRFQKGGKFLKNEESAKKLAKFGFTDMPQSTFELKTHIFNLISTDKELLFSIVNYCIENHLYERTTKHLRLTKTAGWFRSALDELGIKYIYIHHQVNITEGSFFIDGQWVHIG